MRSVLRECFEHTEKRILVSYLHLKSMFKKPQKKQMIDPALMAFHQQIMLNMTLLYRLHNKGT